MREFVREINDLGQFDRVGDLNVLKARVDLAAQNLAKEVEKFKKTTFAKRIKRWAPLVISNLFCLAIREYNPEPTVAVGAEIGLKVLEKIPIGEKSSQNRILRLATNLERDIKALLP